MGRFSDYDWKPLVAWDKQALLNEIWVAQSKIDRLQGELDRRGQRDEMKHGFPIQVRGENGVGITTAYRFFDTAIEAYEAARQYARNNDQDEESAPYKVHPVFLGENDPPLNAQPPSQPTPPLHGDHND